MLFADASTVDSVDSDDGDIGEREQSMVVLVVVVVDILGEDIDCGGGRDIDRISRGLRLTDNANKSKD